MNDVIKYYEELDQDFITNFWFSTVANSEFCSVPQHILEHEYTFEEFTLMKNQIQFMVDLKAAQESQAKQERKAEENRKKTLPQ